jgi:hypothetical protein
MKSSPQPIYQQSEKQHNQAYNQETTTKQQNAEEREKRSEFAVRS